MTIGVERSGLVAMRAIRAEAQGICSRILVVLRRPVPFGKRNPQRCWESSVFRRQCAVNRTKTRLIAGTSLCPSPNDVLRPQNLRRFSVNCSHFSWSARTAIRHGLMRVLKMVFDVRFPRRADALPLACCVFMRLIRCPDNLWRVQPAPVKAARDSRGFGQCHQ